MSGVSGPAKKRLKQSFLTFSSQSSTSISALSPATAWKSVSIADPADPPPPCDTSPVTSSLTITEPSRSSPLSTTNVDVEVDRSSSLCTEENLNTSWPGIWTSDMWTGKQKEYPWLMCRDGKLGCSTCSKTSISVHKLTGVSLSVEWAQCSISHYGLTRDAKLASLRKKIKEHKDSKAHKLAEKISVEAESKKLEKVVDSMTKSQVDATVKVMRTAYYIAQSDRPYSDHPDLIELQTLNGADMGICLRSRFSATNIIDYISASMRQKVCDQIQLIEGKLSILIDESTTLSKLSTLIIYLKVETSKDCDLVLCFLN